MTRPLLLDLFCGAGGAAMGYHRAGFDVIGVDNQAQPDYPFDFFEMDALDFITGELIHRLELAAIHASPPCQAYSAMRTNWNARSDHPDLLPITRELLQTTGLPYVIENVPGAPLEPQVMLCGSAFGLGVGEYQLRRHRWFELSQDIWMMSPPCQHAGPVIGVYGDHGRDRRRIEGYGRYFSLDERRQAMGIDWMKRDALDQAIPPAYTEYIGLGLINALTSTSVRGA